MTQQGRYRAPRAAKIVLTPREHPQNQCQNHFRLAQGNLQRNSPGLKRRSNVTTREIDEPKNLLAEALAKTIRKKIVCFIIAVISKLKLFLSVNRFAALCNYLMPFKSCHNSPITDEAF